jgi:hypothetical protein
MYRGGSDQFLNRLKKNQQAGQRDQRTLNGCRDELSFTMTVGMFFISGLCRDV